MSPSVVDARTSTQPSDRPSSERWTQLIEPGRPSDHYAIHSFLLSQQGTPSEGEFQSQIDEPRYEPCDRLVIRHGRQIVAHVRLNWRTIRIADQFVSAVVLSDLALLPELREIGCAQAMIRVAQHAVREGGGQICLVRTTDPHLFAGSGWFLAPAHRYSTCGARELLAHLRSRQRPPEFDTESPRSLVRNWRQVERSALIRLYKEGFTSESGVWIRDDVAWQWSIGRRAFDRIYVAIQGPDDFELNDSLSRIVGYSIIRDNRVVELVGTSHPERVKSELLERVCSDTIERNGHDVEYGGPGACGIHTTFAAAGGSRTFSARLDRNVTNLMWLPSPHEFLVASLTQRHKEFASHLGQLPVELGFELAGLDRFKLMITRTEIRLHAAARSLRSRLECRPSVFAQLILGQLDVAEAISSGRLSLTTRTAEHLVTALFPQVPWWTPSFDDLEA